MRLSSSGQDTGDEYNIQAIMGDTDVESGIPASKELSAFAEAMCGMNTATMDETRAAVVDILGEAAMLDAAAAVGAFNIFPRVADATGIPLEEMKVEPTAAIREQLGLEAFNLTGKLPG
ncbi:MAG: hypothetical protein O3A84_13240 [Proteobacteria bacterium]|nr:hypothetical protein [Pseudomonadota bacterium]